MSKHQLTQLDLQFARYIAKAAMGDTDKAFAALVDAIGHGNGDYVKYICEAVDCPTDMRKAACLLMILGLMDFEDPL